jgi:rubrerythrin
MPRWSADDIAWDRFRPDLLDADILAVVKAAAMVERNAADYTTYLRTIFAKDRDFKALVTDWQAEEVQHGDMLGRYAMLADPQFDFRARFQRFVDGFRIPMDRTTSVRGSLTGELLARCIVETGTSSFYSALRDATDEPVLKLLCHRIAGDEFRHYKLFYDHMKRYLAAEGVGVIRRTLVAVGRIRETDDDELAYAWHAANEAADLPYERERCNTAYASRAYRFYRPGHAERAVNMVMKAVGINPQGWLGDVAKDFAWAKMRARAAT